MGKIIELSSFRAGFKASNGVVFPQLYRVEGYYFDVVVGQTVASGRPAPPEYSLEEKDRYRGIANATWTPVTKLDPKKDSGWIVVRHHMQSAFVEGYFDALVDLTVLETGEAFGTKQGRFTVLKRAAPAGAKDHLLLFVTKVQLQSGEYAGEWVDAWSIVHPDGSVTEVFEDVVPQYANDDEDEGTEG